MAVHELPSCNSVFYLYDEDEEFSCLRPDNTTSKIIDKIAQGALALCGIFWASMAGLSLKYFLLGSPFLIAGATSPLGISILAFVGFLTIAAYFAHSICSERGTC